MVYGLWVNVSDYFFVNYCSYSTNEVAKLTKHLRVTYNAWRFQFKLSFSV
ncbi:hypothetical protein D047_5108 [Vibrio parahaemolyticus VPTS-2010_2]|nr:hypothetical protein D047_5108 [Vibrio parahaemolyticus VPTS-2010_2]